MCTRQRSLGGSAKLASGRAIVLVRFGDASGSEQLASDRPGALIVKAAFKRAEQLFVRKSSGVWCGHG